MCLKNGKLCQYCCRCYSRTKYCIAIPYIRSQFYRRAIPYKVDRVVLPILERLCWGRSLMNIGFPTGLCNKWCTLFWLYIQSNERMLQHWHKLKHILMHKTSGQLSTTAIQTNTYSQRVHKKRKKLYIDFCIS